MTLRSLLGSFGVVAALTLAMTHFPTSSDASTHAAQPPAAQPADVKQEPPAPASNGVEKKQDGEDGKKEDKSKSVPKRYKAPPPIHDFGEDEEEYAVA